MPERCGRCKGEGTVTYSNKYKKKRGKACPDCGGLGKKIKPDKKTGVFITERPELHYGRDHIFNYYLEDRCKAYIKTKIRGIQKVLNLKRKELNKDGISKLRRKCNNYNRWRRSDLKMLPRELENYIIHDDYLVIDIESMGVSHKKDYGKQYMYETFKILQKFMDNNVRYIMTNWDDSTKAGRAYLKRQGFKRIQNILLWENPAHATEHGYLQTPGHNSGDVHDTSPTLVEGSGPEGNNITEADRRGDETENKIPDSELSVQ